MLFPSELDQLKLNIETSVGESHDWIKNVKYIFS